jgi:cellulose synthase/poly-beta-1,6-N-acetylglucosamine synthase-like glycosyltransferase
MKITFWISFGILFYVWFGYPALLWLLAKVRHKPHDTDESWAPAVSLVIPAYNEEEIIEKKIKNSLSLDYPGSLEVMVVSDGSTDGTVDLASRFSDVTVKHFDERCGKMAVLNKTVPEVNSEIIVFTDANSMFEKDAVRKLVRHLADPSVGCAGGVKKIVPNGKIGQHEKAYWGFETFLKTKESELGSSFVDGAIYAIKKEIYPFPRHEQIIMDDFAVSLGVINENRRVVFEPEAVAYETASFHTFDEFRRKVRILKGAINSIRSFSVKPVLFQLVSHKILRWLSFVFMMTLLISNLFVREGLYEAFLILQACFYGAALIGLGLECLGKKPPKPLYAPFYFCLTTIAQIAGFFKYARGTRASAWEKIKRHKE